MDRGTSGRGLMRRSHVTKICSESSYRRDAILKRPDCDAVCAYGNSVFHRNGERRARCWIINQSPPSRACQSVSTWKLLLPHLVLFSIFLSLSDEEKHFMIMYSKKQGNESWKHLFREDGKSFSADGRIFSLKSIPLENRWNDFMPKSLSRWRKMKRIRTQTDGSIMEQQLAAIGSAFRRKSH